MDLREGDPTRSLLGRGHDFCSSNEVLRPLGSLESPEESAEIQRTS